MNEYIYRLITENNKDQIYSLILLPHLLQMKYKIYASTDNFVFKNQYPLFFFKQRQNLNHFYAQNEVTFN